MKLIDKLRQRQIERIANEATTPTISILSTTLPEVTLPPVKDDSEFIAREREALRVKAAILLRLQARSDARNVRMYNAE